MTRAVAALFLALALGACTTPLQQGERLYREGDRLAALETWRDIPETSDDYAAARERIGVVEEEFEQLTQRYKQRARYFEGKDRLAESILNDRLALKLQPEDQATLDRVQELARVLTARKTELKREYREALERGDLAGARGLLGELRSLDPFEPELETEERQFQAALRAEVTRLLAAGRRGIGAGNYAAATMSFEAVLALTPDNESARGYLSYIETVRREGSRPSTEPAAPLAAPERFASDAQIRAEGFYQNGLAAERTKDYYAAIRHYVSALRADDTHRGARGRLTYVRGQLEGKVDYLIDAGRHAFRNEDLQTALDYWRNALLIDPDNERARAYVGRAEKQLENLERLRADPDVAAGPG